MNFINLTPHAVTIARAGLPALVISPSGQTVRVETRDVAAETVDGIEFVTRQFAGVTGLPEPQQDTIYIVSSLVLERCQERGDLAAPADFVRDDQGRITGAARLVKNL
jgi:hypothetical protein